MNDRSDRLEEKIDKVIDKISSIDTTLATQSIILAEHVKRSTQLENRVEPIERHVNMVNGALKLIGLIGIVASIVAAVVTVIK